MDKTINKRNKKNNTRTIDIQEYKRQKGNAEV